MQPWNSLAWRLQQFRLYPMARPAAPAAADIEKKFLAAVDFAKNGIDSHAPFRFWRILTTLHAFKKKKF